MSKSVHTDTATANGWQKTTLSELLGEMDRIVQIVQCSGEWRLNDIPTRVGETHPPSKSYANIVEHLRQKNAIMVVGKEAIGGKFRKRYRWHAEAKADIRAHLYQRDELPCGCRVHVPSGRRGPAEWFVCDRCGEAAHRRAVIEEVL